MSSNCFGKLFSLTTFGESHGDSVGAVIDGMPAGLAVDVSQLQLELDRRRPGRLQVSTDRNETDQCHILSGVFEGKTLGTPILVLVKNTDQKSHDYAKDIARPGHGDITYRLKYGHSDYRGGGRASGRETVSRVIGGYFAQLILEQVKTQAFITQVGDRFQESAPPNTPSSKKSNLGFIDPSQEGEIEKYLLELKRNGDSCGGKVQVYVDNAPAGLGAPVFDKLKADLAKAMLSIGSCIGIDFGIGEQFTRLNGQQVTQNIENFGGIEAGISNGKTIFFSVSFRPPSTVGEKAKQGRHDPCILPRVLPVVEAMTKIVLADHLLRQKSLL